MDKTVEMLMSAIQNGQADEVHEAYRKYTNEQLKYLWTRQGFDTLPLSRGFFHVHTDLGSPLDSILTCIQYIKTAKEMGCKVITITDHGTMYGVQTLYDLCKNNDIKLIIGVEFYVNDDFEDQTRKKHTRLHLVAYAKDMEGYRIISRLVTESGNRIHSIKQRSESNKTLDYPLISKAILYKYLNGNKGHVILTSACIGGIITGIMFASDNTKQDVQEMKEKIDNAKYAIDQWNVAGEAFNRANDVLCNNILIDKSKMKFQKKENALKKLAPGSQEYITLQQSILIEKQECESAKSEIATAKEAIKQVSKYRRAAQEIFDKISKVKNIEKSSFENIYRQLLESYSSAQTEIVDINDIENYFMKEMAWYDDLAGHGDFYVELQYHGIAQEKAYMPIIAKLAKAANIPLIVGIDAHMQKRDDVFLRAIINSQRFNIFEDPTPDQSELYLKNDGETFNALFHMLGDVNLAAEAMLNRDVIASQCNVELKKEGHYPIFHQ